MDAAEKLTLLLLLQAEIQKLIADFESKTQKKVAAIGVNREGDSVTIRIETSVR